MTQQTTQAVAPKQRAQITLKDRLESPDFAAQVAKALPRHLTPDRFIRVACTALMRTPKLKECDQVSFFNALLTLSQLGLEPDGRRAHLIPFNNRRRSCVECQLIVDYKGIVELVMRSGTVSNMHADVVCESDEFDYDRGQIIRHRIDWRKARGAVYAVYALCRFKDGSEKCEVMAKDEVEAIRNRSRSGNDGPWVTDWNEMAKKTVFRRLSKWLQLSPEARDVVEADDERQDNAASKAAYMEAPNMFATALPEPKPTPAHEPPQEDNIPMEMDGEASAPTGQPELTKLQQAFKDTIVNGGFTFGEWRDWAIELGMKSADGTSDFFDVPDVVCGQMLKGGIVEELKKRRV